jgi:hypothetical protein
MRIDDLLEAVSGKLPEGWSVRCEVENGAAWVEAVGPDGRRYSIDSDETDIERQMNEATEMAQRLDSEAKRKGKR